MRNTIGFKVDIASVVHCLNSAKRTEDLLQLIPIGFKKEWELFDQARIFLKDKDSSKTLQGLRIQLESIVFSDFGDEVEEKENGLSLFNTVRNGKIAFIFLDTRRFGTTATAVRRFIIQDLKSVSARIDSEIVAGDRKPFTVIIDEFADLAQEDFIGFFR